MLGVFQKELEENFKRDLRMTSCYGLEHSDTKTLNQLKDFGALLQTLLQTTLYECNDLLVGAVGLT
jgi:hypothetical protein